MIGLSVSDGHYLQFNDWSAQGQPMGVVIGSIGAFGQTGVSSQTELEMA